MVNKKWFSGLLPNTQVWGKIPQNKHTLSDLHCKIMVNNSSIYFHVLNIHIFFLYFKMYQSYQKTSTNYISTFCLLKCIDLIKKLHLTIFPLRDLHCKIMVIVFRTGLDREVGPWKPGTGMKTGFLSLKNQIFC